MIQCTISDIVLYHNIQTNTYIIIIHAGGTESGTSLNFFSF